MAPHSSTLAWKIPWMEEPGGLQSMGSLRVGHGWATSLSLFTFLHWRRKWHPTPVFLPGESQGRGSLVRCRLWGHTASATTEETAAAAAAVPSSGPLQFSTKLFHCSGVSETYLKKSLLIFFSVRILLSIYHLKMFWKRFYHGHCGQWYWNFGLSVRHSQHYWYFLSALHSGLMLPLW